MSRSVSIYADNQFPNAWTELAFAKDYNKKVNREFFSPSVTAKDGEFFSQPPMSPPSRIRYNQRTDPILQENPDSNAAFRPSVRRIEKGHNDAPIFIPEAPKPYAPSKKNMEPAPSKSLYEVQKRQLKTAECNKANPNPINEGDVKSIYVNKNIRKEPGITDEYKKNNEKKFFLPADRVICPSPKKESTIRMTEAEEKRENVKSLITVDTHPRAKENVIKKCNETQPESSQYGPREYGKTYFGKKKSPFGQM